MLSWKSQLIAYLSTQDQYKDYDFTAANINVEIDILAYNTWLQSFYYNMVASEAFLDTAQLRSSLASRVKDLNYLPASVTGAQAIVNLTFQGPAPTYTIQKGQTFQATVKNLGLVFSVEEDTLLVSANNTFSANINISEGPYVSETQVVSSDPNQRNIIGSSNVDTSSLSVVVFENSQTQGTAYTFATSLLGLTESNRVYFLQLAENGLYEVLFGDGVVGYRPADGSLMVLDYRVSSGSLGNGARQFNIGFNPGPTQDATNINVQTMAVSTGGSGVESLESIRFKAPRHYRVQEHAVEAGDYADILMEEFPEIQAAQTYGGEKLVPPQFAKAFVAVQITGLNVIPDSRRQAYLNWLTPRCPLTIRPVIVDPDYTWAGVATTVTYDIGQTSMSSNSIAAEVSQAVLNWANTNLSGFAQTLRFSRLSEAIDDADTAILGNDPTVFAYRKISPNTGSPQVVTVDFGFPLLQGYSPANTASYPSTDALCVSSSTFTVGGRAVSLQDDGGGNVNIVANQGANTVVVSTVGSVDYGNGVISLTSLTVDSFPPPAILVNVTPQTKDISVGRNTRLQIEPAGISVSVVPVAQS